MFTRKGFISLCLTAWLLVDIKVEAYLSGCSGGYCFVMSNISNTNEFLSQSNAQQWCQSNGTQLVEIRNQGIQSSLVNFIRTAYSQGVNSWNVLTNGKRLSGSWIRLSGNEADDLAVSDQNYLSWAYGYLKSTISGFDLFASGPVDNKYNGGFICSGLTDCSGGVTLNGQCHKSFTETMSWYDARNRCLDAGGDLASFDHITTNAGFNALNGSWISASTSYWIGIRREWWTWQTTSSDVKYSAWLTFHPVNDFGRANTDCLCLSTIEWKWIECGCNQQLPFVCISAPTTSSTTTTPSAASTASTIKTASQASSVVVVSKSNGVSTTTISSTVTSSYSTGNGTLKSGSIGQPIELTCTAVGVIVGLCIGIPLIIVIVALAVVIARLKKQLREAHLSPKANQTTSSKNRIQQPPVGDIAELSGVTEGPYESMQPRTERTTEGCYQSLELSKKTDAVISSNT